jgi:hypothetical protein
MQVAIRHPRLVRKLIVQSAMVKRDGAPPEFWQGFAHASLQNMPAELREAYLKVAPDPKGLQMMHDKCVSAHGRVQGLAGRAGAVDRRRRPDHDRRRRHHSPGARGRDVPHAASRAARDPAGHDHMAMPDRADWQASMIAAFLDATTPKQK